MQLQLNYKKTIFLLVLLAVFLVLLTLQIYNPFSQTVPSDATPSQALSPRAFSPQATPSISEKLLQEDMYEAVVPLPPSFNDMSQVSKFEFILRSKNHDRLYISKKEFPVIAELSIDEVRDGLAIYLELLFQDSLTYISLDERIVHSRKETALFQLENFEQRQIDWTLVEPLESNLLTQGYVEKLKSIVGLLEYKSDLGKSTQLEIYSALSDIKNIIKKRKKISDAFIKKEILNFLTGSSTLEEKLVYESKLKASGDVALIKVANDLRSKNVEKYGDRSPFDLSPRLTPQLG